MWWVASDCTTSASALDLLWVDTADGGIRPALWLASDEARSVTDLILLVHAGTAQVSNRWVNHSAERGRPKSVGAGTPKLSHVTFPDRPWRSTCRPFGGDVQQVGTPAMRGQSVVAARFRIAMTGSRD